MLLVAVDEPQPPNSSVRRSARKTLWHGLAWARFVCYLTHASCAPFLVELDRLPRRGRLRGKLIVLGYRRTHRPVVQFVATSDRPIASSAGASLPATLASAWSATNPTADGLLRRMESRGDWSATWPSRHPDP